MPSAMNRKLFRLSLATRVLLSFEDFSESFLSVDFELIPSTDVGTRLGVGDFLGVGVLEIDFDGVGVGDFVGVGVGSFVGVAVGDLVGVGVGVEVGVGGIETFTFTDMIFEEVEEDVINFKSFTLYFPGPLKPSSFISIFA